VITLLEVCDCISYYDDDGAGVRARDSSVIVGSGVSVVDHCDIAEVERDSMDLDEDLGGLEFLGEGFSGLLDVVASFIATEDAGGGGKIHDGGC
jgi:hypothetical protein